MRYNGCRFRMALLSRKGLLAIAAVIDVRAPRHGPARCPPRSWPRAMLCRPAISSRCSRRWCGSASERHSGSARRLRTGARAPPHHGRRNPARRRHHRGRRATRRHGRLSVARRGGDCRRLGRRSGHSRSRSAESISKNWCERPSRFRDPRLELHESSRNTSPHRPVHDLDSSARFRLCVKSQ